MKNLFTFLLFGLLVNLTAQKTGFYFSEISIAAEHYEILRNTHFSETDVAQSMTIIPPAMQPVDDYAGAFFLKRLRPAQFGRYSIKAMGKPNQESHWAFGLKVSYSPTRSAFSIAMRNDSSAYVVASKTDWLYLNPVLRYSLGKTRQWLHFDLSGTFGWGLNHELGSVEHYKDPCIYRPSSCINILREYEGPFSRDVMAGPSIQQLGLGLEVSASIPMPLNLELRPILGFEVGQVVYNNSIQKAYHSLRLGGGLAYVFP